MAEILLYLKPNEGGNKRYSPGDLVYIAPDGHPWSAAELRPYDEGGHFGVLKIPSVTVEELQAYNRPEFVLQNEDNGMAQRRLWGLDISIMPPPFEDALRATGTFTIPGSGGLWNGFANSLKNKNTGESAGL